MTTTIVIWGAGRIGRGFVADLFADAGYQLVFVDQADALIENLRQAGCYTVVHAASETQREDRVIKDFTALATAQANEIAAAVAQAGLIATAVFPKDFPTVAQQLIPGLLQRRAANPDAPLDIILCTNLAHAAPEFRAPLLAGPCRRAPAPGLRRAWASSRVSSSAWWPIRLLKS